MAVTLSILTFPQRWQNNKLTVRVLIIPRNIDPTMAGAIAPGTDAWCNATIALRARLIADAEKYPATTEADTIFPLPGIAMPANTADIFNDMVTQLGGIKSNTTLENAKAVHRTRKHLPDSYLNSFNFTSLRTKDASIDDAYHCAIKDKTEADPNFKTSEDSLSWGKVFAYCLRQPALAQRVGFVYEATIDVNPALVKQGSWLYIDLDDGCSYKAAMDADPKMVKRFAARIPKLKKDEDRALFAAIQFPVLLDAAVVPPNPLDEDVPVQPNNMDELLIEAQQYDDGFCKIVHANQPVSSDLLREKEDKELPVITDAGIRLAWDDEQLLIWMNRQLKKDDAVLTTGGRNIAPMGVMQYRVDVRLNSDAVPNPNLWLPLCRVKNNANLMIGQSTIDTISEEKELGVEVYPAQLDHRKNEPFWLPQYFANWIGKSLVLADVDAITIFQKEKNDVPGKKANKFNQYSAAGLDGFQLLYGTKYDFRVRLADISGGGPTIDENRVYAAAAPEGFCDFRRRVQPQTVRPQEVLPEKDDEFFKGNELNMLRPLLGYPSVLFTGKYPNAVNDLMAEAVKLNKTEVGLADPDVESVEVLIEVKALEMDMLLRHDTDSHESYAKLYITKRKFPVPLDGNLNIPITFVDAPVLNFTDSQDLGTLGLVAGGDDIDTHADIVLPTSRNIRITLRPVVENKPEYYAKDSSLPRKGKPVVIVTRKASENETALFKPTATVDTIRGVWLQPDTDTYLRASLGEIFVENYQPTNTSSIMERLADAIDKSIDVEAKGLSLLGKPGVRVQFGASRFIRNNMSPDSTNITFSTKSDLLNHWVIPITLLLNRDWTWDGAMPVSFDVFRQKKMVGAGLTDEERDTIPWGAEELVGDIEMKQTINIQALYNPDRSQTQICFLDAVEPKTEDVSALPEEIMVQYRIKANFKSLPDAAAVTSDADTVLQLHLPITTKPAQVPKIVSAGIAQSKYINDELYSSTEPRKRYLWLEFAEPLRNKKDAYFIRMLAYSPDPLLAQWQSDMFKAPEEPSLPISPEPIRIISPGHTDDESGLNAMQELTKADDSNVHYLVPLPPGLHAASAELFGFITYELRVGHKIGWSTAQGRFGSALRTTGVQHPLPQLFGVVNRNEKHVMVTAPFAQTVFNGADVTSKPPRTQLWALLYAQVKRADDQVYRNVLLDDQLFVRRRINIDPATGKQVIEMNTDAVQYGITGWKNKDINIMLQQYGLPVDSNLSVLVVEMLPTYDKFSSPFSRGNNAAMFTNNEFSNSNQSIVKLDEGMEIQHFKTKLNYATAAANNKQLQLEANLQLQMEEQFINQAQKEEFIRPLTDQLGSERILRTSTLVPVPPICCTDC
jgi:hypothetical protein